MKYNFRELNKLANAYDKILSRCGAEALRFIKQRFDEQNWIGNHTQPWKRSKAPKKGNSLINTGTLKRSIRIASKSADKIIIATDSKYAQIHNEGGKIPLTKKMRGFFFFKAKQLMGGINKTADGRKRNNTRNRKINAQAQLYINMATTKKKNLIIPKRQFIGHSPYLDKRLERIMVKEINSIIR